MPELDAEARILLSLPDGVRDRVQQLRALVREAIPEAEERPHPGWGIFNFYLEGELSYVGARKDAAVLGFSRGAALVDPAGLLTSTRGAKQMRQLRLRADQPLPREAIKGFLRQAVELNLRLGSPGQRASG